MAKRSIFYKIRRMGQVLAYDLMSPEFMSKLYFRHVLGKSLDLKNPKSFNEKLQWLKLYYWPENPKAVQCADKYAVRSYIKEMGKEEILNELLFAWDSVDEICWEELPEQFVLKCNHGCGYNILCPDKSKLDEKTVKRQLRKWMRENFYKFNEEPHYGRIPKKIICEKYLGDNVINYNIYCFNGKPTFFSLAGGLGNGVGEHLTYYNVDGTKADFRNGGYPAGDNVLSPLLPQMVEMAQYLSQGFPMVRVDLFDVNGRIILSEMTFTPGGALIPFEPDAADCMLGEKLDISQQMKEKAGIR